MKHIGIIGAGAWGTALSLLCARAGHKVTLWMRDAGQAQALNQDHENKKRLPGIKLPDAVTATSDVADLKGVDAYLNVIPAQTLRSFLTHYNTSLNPKAPYILCSKGIEIETGKLLQEVAQDLNLKNPLGVLSGPNFAREIALGKPAASTFAMEDLQEAKAWSQVFSTDRFRLYPSDDRIGVEVGGSLKNVIAIAAGLVTGAELGENARAALITRGLQEIANYGIFKGARRTTFMGLSGIGDLMLCTFSPTSRNMKLGLQIGRGATLEEITHDKGAQLTEGAFTAQALMEMLKKTSELDLPICQAVYQILFEGSNIKREMMRLFDRPMKIETGS